MPSKRWYAARKSRRLKRRRARRRRRARGEPTPDIDDATLISSILRALSMNVARPKPPVDPYARGSVVPPMKTAQKVSAEHVEQTLGKSPWGNRPYGLMRPNVPIWGGDPDARWGARAPLPQQGPFMGV